MKPKIQPDKRPMNNMITPCQRKTAEASKREKPIDLKIAISLVFSITMIAKTLKIPKPDKSKILETVMAEEMRKALKTSSQTFSRSCQLTER